MNYLSATADLATLAMLMIMFGQINDWW